MGNKVVNSPNSSWADKNFVGKVMTAAKGIWSGNSVIGSMHKKKKPVGRGATGKWK